MSTVKLDYPIQCEGVTVDSITLRRPKARDLKTMETTKGGDISKSITLIAHLAEITPQAVEDLDAADFQKASEVIAGFLGTALSPVISTEF
ncbi:phage tail assembly protein [Spartinivicinus poritis]|uniref:Phage tail assembly protein n=1 Tax=Spartinivicinus poritis TaxID=2994640 RepID=A0ABT5UHB0_9GAMM|nr:phage tail assembly protein [Spartinivicinus sp. A2-2]MDE1465600.1 phage tail assembly protein [Spartinivicinus sp. A2-2]